MYKQQQEHQISVFDFNQSFGTPLDTGNEWVKLADEIDWKSLEVRYAGKFTSHTGRPARPLRMMLGALIIQQRRELSDAALIRTISEDPSLQYFLGLEVFEHKAPFGASTLRRFKMRLDPELLEAANWMLPKDLELPEDVIVSKKNASEENWPAGDDRPEGEDEAAGEGAFASVCASGEESGAQSNHAGRYFYFTRHGQTVWNMENKICGATDSPLTEYGQKQARELGRRIASAGIRIDEILYSPLLRAADTARRISEETGIPIREEPRLTEQHFGRYEGTPRDGQEFARAKLDFLSHYDGGESMMQLCQRIYNLLDDLKKDGSGKIYLLVAHNGISRAVESYCRDMTNEEYASFGIGNCEVRKYYFPDIP